MEKNADTLTIKGVERERERDNFYATLSKSFTQLYTRTKITFTKAVHMQHIQNEIDEIFGFFLGKVFHSLFFSIFLLFCTKNCT